MKIITLLLMVLLAGCATKPCLEYTIEEESRGSEKRRAVTIEVPQSWGGTWGNSDTFVMVRYSEDVEEPQ